jgi:hypothetical protein
MLLRASRNRSSPRRAPDRTRLESAWAQPARPPLGNQTLQRLLRSGAVQAKLTVNQPGDRYEKEADRVAESVMRMPDPTGPPTSTAASPQVQRACAACAGGGPETCAECAEEPAIHRKEASDRGPEPGPALLSSIAASRAGGQSLPQSERAFFEPRFGHDFGQVRIHTGAKAAESAHSLGAYAYTLGHDIVFDQGRFAPGTGEGRKLLAHELMHVVQQGSGEPLIQRKVREGNISCRQTGLTGGVPGGLISGPDAIGFITAANQKAVDLSQTAEAMLSKADAPDPKLVKALKDRFGLNTADPAHAKRIQILHREFKAVAGFLAGGSLYYECRSADCDTGDWAFTYAGQHTIHLCNPFWNAASLNLRGSTLLHETFHLWWDQVDDYGHPPLHNAHCFEQFALDLAGATGEIPPNFSKACKV